MTLLAGNQLERDRFFSSGNPDRRGSSFDLKIGRIYDGKGNRVEGQYVLRPNEMVQVVSEESFDLPKDVTAHVSYKTALTSKGIWGLTVGIVDPGWNCPISTTLFNFSKVDFPVQEGAVFLRVSLFEHEPVDAELMHVGSLPPDYLRSVQSTAATYFPKQFLDVERVSDEAGSVAMKRMQDRALTWIAMVAGLFALIQLVMSWAPPIVDWYFEDTETNAALARKIQGLEDQIKDLRGSIDAVRTSPIVEDVTPSLEEQEPTSQGE